MLIAHGTFLYCSKLYQKGCRGDITMFYLTQPMFPMEKTKHLYTSWFLDINRRLVSNNHYLNYIKKYMR